MAWIAPTRENLTAALSIDEQRFYREKLATEEDGLVASVLERAVARCWGYLRKSGVRLGAAGTLPPEVLPYAMDLAAYNLIVRINLIPSEGRTRLNEEAIAFLEKVAEGDATVEPGTEAVADQYTDSIPLIAKPDRMFTRQREEGI